MNPQIFCNLSVVFEYNETEKFQWFRLQHIKSTWGKQKQTCVNLNKSRMNPLSRYMTMLNYLPGLFLTIHQQELISVEPVFI